MLSNGRPYLAIPGPSVMPDAVLRAMHRAAPNIYTGELHEVTRSLVPDLARVAGTAHHTAIYIGNGHAAWEAALANVVAPGETVLVLATGHFGHAWGGVADGLGIALQVEDFGQRSPVDPDRVTEILRGDTDGRIKAILAVHVDTATGVKSDIAAIRAGIDRAGHAGLLMVDCIASLGCDRYEMDAWGANVTVAACQKGLMTPPGLGFVWFDDRAAAVRDAMPRVSRYWDWRPRANPTEYWMYWAGTAPTHHVYGLRAALDIIADEGLEAIWQRHEILAHAIWAAVDAWGADGPMTLNIPDAAARSHAVTSVEIGGADGDRLRAWCEGTAGLTLGIGLGRTPASAFFRIGHMGHVNAQMVLGTLATMEAGLCACDIAHGKGAVEAAARVIAQAG